jgi:D-3-phosphoglycerate dehydrogenase / 2-oxoglutarate reductase
MTNIIVTTPSFCKYVKEPITLLNENKIGIIYDYGLEEFKEFKDKEKDSIKAIIVGLEKINEAVLEHLPNVKVIVKHGAGIDNIDLELAKKKNINVYNVPGANRESVADAAIALMLNLSRMICLADKSVRAGKWERFYGVELGGKTLSIIGFGAIGKSVAKRAIGFGMKVLAYDIYPSDMDGVEIVDLDYAIENGDYISLHTPLLDSTYHLINKERIRKMKSNLYLINTARGGLIDEEALIEALANKRIAGAAIDVHENEPIVNPGFFNFDNVIVTPHLAGFTQEATNKISYVCADYIIRDLKKRGNK